MGLFRTHGNWAATFCRIALAAVLLPHGLDKLLEFDLFGWRGPDAWRDSIFSLISTDAIPPEYKILIAQATAWVEVIAGASCVLGLLVRVAMVPLIGHFIGAALLVHARNGFWLHHTTDGKATPGFEYVLVLALMALGLFFSGAGSVSLDKLIGGDAEMDELEEDVVYE